MIRPLRRVAPHHWLSRDGRFTFLRDNDYREWWAYDNSEPAYDFKNEGTGRPVEEGKTGDILGSRDTPINLGERIDTLRELVQLVEDWVAADERDAGPKPLSDEERAVLAALPAGGGLSSYVYVEGLSSRKINDLLAKLEERGLVERSPNGHGPEKPWWWEKLPEPSDEPRDAPPTAKGTIYDRAEPGGRPVVSFECSGEVNEFGCAAGSIKAGTNNPRKAWVPLHLLNNYPWWTLRKRGEVTEWSAQFFCPIHGECSEEMVRTDKCCAICGSLLDRGVT